MISLSCDHCDKPLRVRDELAGKRIKCPGCGGVVAVPVDADEDAPAPKKKAPVRRRVEDDDDDAPRDAKKGPPKPSTILFIAGLTLALGGLVLMALFIYFSVMAGREGDAKDTLLQQLRADQQANPNASEDHKTSLKNNIEKNERERNAARSSSTRNMIIAIVFGILFLAGVGLRGYHHMLMKKWHAAKHSGKKKKKRDPDDD